MDQIHLKRYGVCYLFKIFSALMTIGALVVALLVLIGALAMAFGEEAAFGILGVAAVLPVLGYALVFGICWAVFAKACNRHEQAYLAAARNAQKAAQQAAPAGENS